MRRRRSLSKRRSARNFRRGKRTKAVNKRPRTHRGGWRL